MNPKPGTSSPPFISEGYDEGEEEEEEYDDKDEDYYDNEDDEDNDEDNEGDEGDEDGDLKRIPFSKIRSKRLEELGVSSHPHPSDDFIGALETHLHTQFVIELTLEEVFDATWKTTEGPITRELHKSFSFYGKLPEATARVVANTIFSELCIIHKGYLSHIPHILPELTLARFEKPFLFEHDNNTTALSGRMDYA